MGTRQNVPFLERCGLTFDDLAAAHAKCPREPDSAPTFFSIRMVNDVKSSDYRRPSVPTAKGRLELLRVVLRGDVLTVAEIKGQRRKEIRDKAGLFGARLYALKTISMEGATVFMFLSELPAGVADDKFLPAEGSAALYDNELCGPRVLKACGIHQSKGKYLSWIFNATEI
jgi:hypothetical protein